MSGHCVRQSHARYLHAPEEIEAAMELLDEDADALSSPAELAVEVCCSCWDV